MEEKQTPLLVQGPTLEDFCDAANALYEAPTENKFYAVVNLARDVLMHNAKQWDAGYAFGRRTALNQDALQRLTDVNQEIEQALSQPEQQKCSCFAHSAAECVCGAWDKPDQLAIQHGLLAQHCKMLEDKLKAYESREWQGLSDDEIDDVWRTHQVDECASHSFARAIEAKLKERNG